MTHTSTLDVLVDEGHRFQATLHTSPSAASPCLLFLPALGTPARAYFRLAAELANHGVNACVPDWRGIGSSSVRVNNGVDFGYRELLEADIPPLTRKLRELFPHSPIWIGGHSLGGQIGLLAASTSATPVSGVLLIASGSVHLPCYPAKLRLSIRAVTLLARLSGTTLGYFPGNLLGFGGREARRLMLDWSNVAHSGQYRASGSQIDYEKSVAELESSILALTFAADSWAPPEATQALLGKARRAATVHWHWDRNESGGHDLNHFNWLRTPAVIAPPVAAHIRQNSSRTPFPG